MTAFLVGLSIAILVVSGLASPSVAPGYWPAVGICAVIGAVACVLEVVVTIPRLERVPRRPQPASCTCCGK